MNPGDVVYYAKTKGSVKPLGPANNFKKLKPKIALLWGDPLYVTRVDGANVEVSSKGHIMRLPQGDVMTTPVLALYQVDCGQGDSALLHTPDDRWIMIDGGPSPAMANSPALGVRFLWWKVFVDQSWRQQFAVPGPFKLAALVVTHPDEDHFGGLPEVIDYVKPGNFEIDAIYHNGMGRFDGDPVAYDGSYGFGQLGPVEGAALPDAGLTTLLNDEADICGYGQTTPSRAWKLDGNYADFLKSAAGKVGAGIGEIHRVTRDIGTLPGFAPASGNTAVHVLGPVEEKFGTKSGLRYLDGGSRSAMGGPSLTRNGHSIVLRVDYGAFRMVMTGDLNFKSQAVLLKNVPAGEFACHVAKACHHGAEDISCTFLQAMSPLATLFSSGDNETYAHPRAKALASAAVFGRRQSTGGTNRFLQLVEDEYSAPLIYSTELSRSVELFDVHSVLDGNGGLVPKAQIVPVKRSYGRKSLPGTAQPAERWLLADKLVYGLINVRTDGHRVVIAVLKEDDASFQVEEFKV
jgi:hypothetical protein